MLNLEATKLVRQIVRDYMGWTPVMYTNKYAKSRSVRIIANLDTEEQEELGLLIQKRLGDHANIIKGSYCLADRPGSLAMLDVYMPYESFPNE